MYNFLKKKRKEKIKKFKIGFCCLQMVKTIEIDAIRTEQSNVIIKAAFT